jgi:outer membrane protein
MKRINTISTEISTQMLLPGLGKWLLFFSAMFWQGAAQAADLVELYQAARQHDPVYAAAQSTWAAAQEKLPQARALLRPDIALSASSSYTSADTEIQGSSIITGGVQEFNTNGVGVTLTQPLYRKQDWMQYEQSELLLKQADAELKAVEQDLILRAAQAYFDVLAAQDSLLFVTAQKQAIERQLLQAKRKFEVGTNTITDVHEAQAGFDLVLSQVITAKNDVLIKNRALGKIIGAAPPALAKLGENWDPTYPDPMSEEQWMTLARQSNPNVIRQSAALDIATMEVERQQAGHFPTLDLVASYQEDSANGSATFGIASDSTTKSVGVQLSVPLYSGGATSSRKREALHSKEAVRYLLEDSQRNAAFDSSQAFLGLINGIAQVKALEQAVISNESSMKSSERGWEVGTRTAVDVLNAQQQLFSAKRDLQQSRYNTLLSQLKLDAAAGRLTLQSVENINTWLVE